MCRFLICFRRYIELGQGSEVCYTDTMDEQDELQAAQEELQALALEGLHSGEPIRADAKYWEDLHTGSSTTGSR